MTLNVGDKPPTGFPAGTWGELAARLARKQSTLPPRWPVSGLAKDSLVSPSRVLVQGIQWLYEAWAGVHKEHSLRLPLRGQRRLGSPRAMRGASLLPVELRRANHEREHQLGHCKARHHTIRGALLNFTLVGQVKQSIPTAFANAS